MESVKDRITIIVPVYNAEAYLARCIDSLLSQTYPDVEIILVNDGSTDDSSKICNSYTQEQRPVLVLNQRNQGVSAARNKGLKYASGEYVIFVDADDWIRNDYCSTLHSALADETDLVVCGYFECFGNVKYECAPKRTFRISNKHFDTQFEAIYHHCPFNAPWGKLFRKDKIGNLEFEVGRAVGEDLLFNLAYLEGTSRELVFIPYVGYYYNKENLNSAMRRFREDDFNQKVFFYKEMLKFCDSYNIFDGGRKEVGKQLCIDGLEYLKMLYSEGYPRDYEKKIARKCLDNDDFMNACSVWYGGRMDFILLQCLCKIKCESGLHIACKAINKIRRMRNSVRG